MAKSHVSRTLEMFRFQKVPYAPASGYNYFSKKRWDLIGVIDYVAFYPNWKEPSPSLRLVGVQICGADFQPHVRKINASKLAKMWVGSGNVIMLIGWTKLKKSGWKSRTHLWEKRGDFSPVPSQPLKKVPDISAL